MRNSRNTSVKTDGPFDNRRAVYHVSHNGEHQLISVENIVYVEASGSYCKIFTVKQDNDVQIFLKSTHLKTVQKALEQFEFVPLIRCQRRYIVNLRWIAAVKREGKRGIITLNKPLANQILYSSKYVSLNQLLGKR